MSLVLFNMNIRKNFLLFIIFLLVLFMYLGVMVSMYKPEDMTAITDMLKLFPETMMKAMGLSNIVTDLTGYLASWLYGLLMIAFPMVYCIILGNRLVAKMVDNGSFAYLLSTPNSRIKIILTQGIYALLSVFLLFVFITAFGVVVCNIALPKTLDVNQFINLNFTTMLVNMVVMMISFFFSCLFNEAKLSLGFGAGIPIAFLLMNMLGGASKDAESLKKVSIYGMYDPIELVKGSGNLNVNIFYIGIIIVLFTLALIIFNKKRLPL